MCLASLLIRLIINTSTTTIKGYEMSPLEKLMSLPKLDKIYLIQSTIKLSKSYQSNRSQKFNFFRI